MRVDKKIGILAGLIVLVVCVMCVVVLVVHGAQRQEQSVVQESFGLSAEVYDKAEFLDITADEFDRLIAERKSFIVVLHMTVCPAEFPIRDVAKRFAYEKGLTIYGLKEDEFKKTSLADVIKYLPSAAVYRDGELVGYLDAEADEDTEYYKTIEGFWEWLERQGVSL